MMNAQPQWKEGAWVIFNLSIGQVKKIKDSAGEWEEFSDGMFTTSGKLSDCFRPLTLRNKYIIETLDGIYCRLHDIDGNAGFNFPNISRYFNGLALQAIDDGDDDSAIKQIFDAAAEFVREAREYHPIIQGVKLFRRK